MYSQNLKTIILRVEWVPDIKLLLMFKVNFFQLKHHYLRDSVHTIMKQFELHFSNVILFICKYTKHLS